MEKIITNKFPSVYQAEIALMRAYELLSSEPEKAKDLLGMAKRTLSGSRSDKAAIYEARAYDYLGQLAEGRILIRALIKRGGLSQENLAHAIMVLAVLERETPSRSLETLKKINLEGLPAYLLGRIHTQFARRYRDLNHLDEARIEYSGALHFFEEIKDVRGIAHTLNNRAAIDAEFEDFERAHADVDRCLAITPKGDPFLSQFKDHKAQILNAERRFEEAETWAREALNLVEGKDCQRFIVESLCTLAESLAGQGQHDQARYTESLKLFDRAREVADNLDDNELRFKVATARKRTAEEYVRVRELEVCQLALMICHDSYRAAALKLGITHPTLISVLEKNKVRWKDKRPRSIMCNSSK
jgi:tetratricopeptide (TPR) repeat protein